MSPPRTYQDEPAVSDYRRSVSGYGSDRNSEPDREISLSTPSILGLFFALAIVCGCIYALGFAMGRRSTPTIPAAVTDTTLAPATGSPKPDAGQPSAADPAPASTALATPAAQSSAAQSSGTQTATVPLAPWVSPAAPTASSVAPAVSGATQSAVFMVQVAAVSSQDVADILITSLKKKGYAVAVHQEPQDKLLHVQIGPFPDRAAAEAMRQRVLADGFNAIVK